MGEEDFELSKFQIDILQAVDRGEVLKPRGINDPRDWRTLLKLGYVTMEGPEWKYILTEKGREKLLAR